MRRAMPTFQHHAFRFHDLISTASDKILVTVVGAGASAPLWKYYLQSVSDLAALAAPIVALILGCLHVALKIREWRRGARVE